MRKRIESLSAPALAGLARVPFWLPLTCVVALLVIGALVGGIFGVFLLALPVLFASWLLYLTWPKLSTTERAMRLAVWTLLVVIAVVAAFPRDVF